MQMSRVFLGSTIPAAVLAPAEVTKVVVLSSIHLSSSTEEHIPRWGSWIGPCAYVKSFRAFSASWFSGRRLIDPTETSKINLPFFFS